MNHLPLRQGPCTLCGERYDGALGLPESGLALGIRFEDVPADWICIPWGAVKSSDVLMEA